MNIKLFFKVFRRIMGVALTVFILAMGIGFAFYYFFPNSGFSGMVDKMGTKQVNILVLATDKGGLLTDTMMVASVDNERKKVNVLSIPRDTRVTIGNTKNNKMNSVYGHYKEGMREKAVIDKVTEMTNLKINYYVVVHPDGFRNIIDILGGVYIDVPMNMNYDDPTQDLHIHLKKGYQLLDGAKAEQFTRFRSGYATADLGRIQAQQTFIKALYEQKLNPSLILKLPSIFGELSKNVKTNFSARDLPRMIKILSTLSKEEIKTHQLPGKPQMINGGSYYIYDDEETKKLIETEFLGQNTDEENNKPDNNGE